MPNHLDFLLALDEATRASHGSIGFGVEMAQRAGLCQPGELVAARWTGELVHVKYVTHGVSSHPRPLPSGPQWSDADLQSVGDYRVTAGGRAEADRMRRLAREARTDAALHADLRQFAQPWMTEDQRRAIADQLRELRDALDGEHVTAAIGAAKNLVEAACILVLEAVNEPVPRDTSLPTLFKLATGHARGDVGDGVGRSLTSTVQRLAELRNTVGAGHGQSSIPPSAPRHARLAASAATGITDYCSTPI